MNVGVTSAALGSVVCITAAVAILFRRPRRLLYSYFSAFAVSLFLWHAASLAARIAGQGISRWQIAAALLMPPLAILFFRELLRNKRPASRRFVRSCFIATGSLLLVNFSPWGKSWPALLLMTLYVLGTLLTGLRSLQRHTRRAHIDSDRTRLSTLFYGGFIALVLACGELLPEAVVLLAALGHVAVTFYVYFLYQSIVARRLIDLVDLLGKAAVVAVLTLVLASVYALLVLWVGSNQQSLWLFNTLVASFVILILYDQVRPWIEKTTAKLLFRNRFELRQVVRRLLQTLRTTISIDDMREHTLNALHVIGRANQVAIYLAAEDNTFHLSGFRGEEPPRILSLALQPTLLQELRRDRRPILLEHLAHRYQELPTLLAGGDPTLERELERIAETISAMHALRATVVLPMRVEERILGVLTLRAEHAGEAFSTDELTTLLSLAEACAIVIENSHEYEKRRERDRLVAVGEMATGMAHEIRNPLGAIKGAAQCLEPASLPPEAREFVEVIIEEVGRLNGVVVQFLEYARPWRGNPVPTQINDVIAATTRLLARDAAPAGVEIRHDLGGALPEVSIDPEQLKQVLINLLLNAIEAMPKGGVIDIKTETSRPNSAAATGLTPTHVLVRISDTGEGIRPENLSRIFVPFFTTKTRGTGLGLAISQRIIENAGGRIDVSSFFGLGTTFTVRLAALTAAAAPQPLAEILDDEATSPEATFVP